MDVRKRGFSSTNLKINRKNSANRRLFVNIAADKRGTSGFGPVIQAIIVFVVIGLFLGALLIFIGDNARGELFKKQILAKQLCLIMTSAKNNTMINLSSDLLIEQKDNLLIIKRYSYDSGYSYPCTSANFTLISKDNAYLIEIE